ncbi:Tigger transposable element-derived protein 6 [Araneus ventricosus]|uniref:Tigger transposable element-derived protein 6 n=1 Tax=Araneus ventricosus TaxID=182803 RepID=A0A4Y2DJT1_ARAVE|nr:Tigger transposable element-derived protein 6 [Araneus ventricosus]
MTSEFFSEWLKQINKKICKEKRKIALFVDNCTVHSLIPEMNALKVVLLPPNTTPKLQPLDQGIIRNFKVFCRKELVKKFVDSIDNNQKMKPFNILDCMRMAYRSWMNVTQKTIKNCFEKSDFSSVECESDAEQELHTAGLFKEILSGSKLL